MVQITRVLLGKQTRCSFLFFFVRSSSVRASFFIVSNTVNHTMNSPLRMTQKCRVYIYKSRLGVWAPPGSFTSALISCCIAARLWHCLSLFPSSCATEGNPTLPSARSVAHNSWGRGCMQCVKHFSLTEEQNENSSQESSHLNSGIDRGIFIKFV